jgi:hypothetical protein
MECQPARIVSLGNFWIPWAMTIRRTAFHVGWGSFRRQWAQQAKWRALIAAPANFSRSQAVTTSPIAMSVKGASTPHLLAYAYAPNVSLASI